MTATTAQKRAYLGALGLTLLVVVAAFWETAASMVNIWIQNKTFNHGIVIPVISAYLVWSERHRLTGLPMLPSWLGILALASVGLTWSIGYVVDVQLLQHLALVGFFPAAVLAICGPAYLKVLAFPLGYLLFAVPFGEFLIPHLMDFTAAFTVWAVDLTGIPIFQEGRFFRIPSGNFEVAIACSGIRYLIASLALGTLYAYMMYESPWRRLLLVALSIVVPIVGNGIRAYGIVMLAHASEMTIAVGVDHIIYGWIFFGVLMLALFFVGRLFREDDVGLRAKAVIFPKMTGAAYPILVIGIALAIPLIFKFTALQASKLATTASYEIPAGLPLQGAELNGPIFKESNWRPEFVGVTGILTGVYQDRSAYEVDVYVGYYQTQSQGAELVGALNRIYNADHWKVLAEGGGVLSLDSGDWQYRETVLTSAGGRRRLVWWWYEMGGMSVTNELQAKLIELRGLLASTRSPAAVVAASVPIEQEIEASRTRLGHYLGIVLQPIRDCINDNGTVCAGPRN